MEDNNRLEKLLVEKKKTNKWLSGQLRITASTVSKWCTNTTQPDMETMAIIAKLLNVVVEELYDRRFIESIYYRNRTLLRK